MSAESHLPELTDAARRAESIVSDQINAIVDVVQSEADEIRRSAEEDAKETRREAMESAQRVLQSLDALERPLGELVQTLRGEMDRVGRELEGPVAVEATAIPAPPESRAGATAPRDGIFGASVEEVAAPPEHRAPPEPEPEPAPRATPEPRPARDEGVPSQRKPAPAEAAQPGQGNGRQTGNAPTDRPQPVLRSPTDLGPQRKSDRFWSRLKGGRGKIPFVASQGHCAVCQKPFMAGTEENLRLSGWKVSGDVGACPECQADGWKLPVGARLPFRSSGG